MLSDSQLGILAQSFRNGALDASGALAKWLGTESLITIDEVVQCDLTSAVSRLGRPDEILCYCLMTVSGSLTGCLLLSFDDSSGTALADLLLNRPTDSNRQWSEVEESAALETHNIVGCAYLNSLIRHLPSSNENQQPLIPSPPEFCRDFVGSVMETALLPQIANDHTVFQATARFELDGRPLNWNLMFVPDARSMDYLCESLPQGDSGQPGDQSDV